MEYWAIPLIIELVEGNDLLPAGYMSDWAGPPESIPEGWVLVDREELKARILGWTNGI